MSNLLVIPISVTFSKATEAARVKDLHELMWRSPKIAVQPLISPEALEKLKFM